MSTFIKVTQEGNKLLRLNAQQTQAARLGKVEADEQRRAKQQAQEARQRVLQQQGRDANGDAVGDARRRRFRMDEPAATAISSPSLLITWDGGLPILSSSEPTLVDSTNEGFASTITAGGTTQAVGVNGNDAWRFGNDYPAVMYEFKTKDFGPKGKADFTMECWMQFVIEPRTYTFAEIGLYLDNDNDDNWTYFGCDYARGYSPRNENGLIGWYARRIIDPSTDPYSQDQYYPDPSWLQSANPIHMCIMRQQGGMHYYLNGNLVKSDTTPEILTLDFGDYGGYVLYFAMGRQRGTGTAKFGPIRFTPNRARYNPAGFTPNLLPFRP